MGRTLDLETGCAAAVLGDCGVKHNDIRPSNTLWNTENRRVLLVDYQRSAILNFLENNPIGKAKFKKPGGTLGK